MCGVFTVEERFGGSARNRAVGAIACGPLVALSGGHAGDDDTNGDENAKHPGYGVKHIGQT